MKEVINKIEYWRQLGKPIAIATNVKLERASLRPLGAKMVLTSTLDISGSVTGGFMKICPSVFKSL
ncbi:MAG: hypothetical protein BGO78_16785 [Chloroflexi bacterium 44-23]|nr:MAG: hypothetical protein BGO78_16785 [Chloroflexi bacterium 44-23]